MTFLRRVQGCIRLDKHRNEGTRRDLKYFLQTTEFLNTNIHSSSMYKGWMMADSLKRQQHTDLREGEARDAG